MRNVFLCCILLSSVIFFACDEDKTPEPPNASDDSRKMGIVDTSTARTADTMKMMRFIDAKAMLERYRTADVKIKNDHAGNTGDKSTLWVTLNVDQLRELLADQSITAFHILTAAYSSKKPTMIIRVIKNNKINEPLYYGVATEMLCPDPPDCNVVPVPSD
jgi:hypothetical protein